MRYTLMVLKFPAVLILKGFRFICATYRSTEPGPETRNNDLLVEQDENGLAAVHVGVPKDMEHLIPRLLDAQMVGRVNHEDQGIGVDEVVAPQRPQLGLAPDVPCGTWRIAQTRFRREQRSG